jgi:hypothetical protein
MSITPQVTGAPLTTLEATQLLAFCVSDLPLPAPAPGPAPAPTPSQQQVARSAAGGGGGGGGDQAPGMVEYHLGNT